MTGEEQVPRGVWSGGIYFVALTYLGVTSWWRALVVGILVVVLIACSYGGRWVERGGFLLLVGTVLVWIGVVPPVQEWRNDLAWLGPPLHSAIVSVRQAAIQEESREAESPADRAPR